MDRFMQMRAFVAVVEAGSFIKAADSLDMSKSAVSRLVGDLEARLGVRLLQRTTRRLSLTTEGEVFRDRCIELLGGVEEAEAEITARAGEAAGQLRMNVPVTLGMLYLAPLWPQFMRKHPKVMLEVTLGDRMVDLVEEGYDLAVRIAKLPSSSLISRKIAKTRLVLCASPEYLERRGTPMSLPELSEHAIITYSLLAMGEQWQFQGPDGEVTVKVTSRMRSNNGDTCCAAALKGQGLVLQPTLLVGPHLESGALVEVLPQYRSIELGVYAVYPTRKHVSPKVRLMIDFLIESFRKPAWPD